jgi:hypothetical protein
LRIVKRIKAGDWTGDDDASAPSAAMPAKET